MPFPFTSETTADLTTSNDGEAVSVTIVGSSSVSPSLSSPSSLLSITSFVFPGLLAVAKTVLFICPLSTAC